VRFPVPALAVALAALIPSSAWADSLFDMAQKLPNDQFTSAKSSDALEYCIGLTIGDWLIPITLRGEKQVMVYGSPNMVFSNQIYMLVRIQDRGDQRAVTFHAHKAWDEKTAALIRSCI